jgi:hypothetical protein
MVMLTSTDSEVGSESVVFNPNLIRWPCVHVKRNSSVRGVGRGVDGHLQYWNTRESVVYTVRVSGREFNKEFERATIKMSTKKREPCTLVESDAAVKILVWPAAVWPRLAFDTSDGIHVCCSLPMQSYLRRAREGRAATGVGGLFMGQLAVDQHRAQVGLFCDQVGDEGSLSHVLATSCRARITQVVIPH